MVQCECSALQSLLKLLAKLMLGFSEIKCIKIDTKSHMGSSQKQRNEAWKTMHMDRRNLSLASQLQAMKLALIHHLMQVEQQQLLGKAG